jgi:hypothetical protein
MHAQNDSRETSARGRAAFMESFEDQVDPDRVLPEAERKRRAAQARKAYFAGLAFKSAKARRQRKVVDASDGRPHQAPAAKTASDTPDAVRAE